MPDNKYRVSGAMFPNDKPNGPVFSGFVEIDGVKTHIALWEKQSKAGNDYLQVSEDKRAAEKAAGQSGGGGASKFRRPAASPTSGKPNPNLDMDDDIPFSPEMR